MGLVQVKLNHAIGILSKLRHNTNLKVLKILSFTVSDVIVNLQSGAQLWHQANKKVETKYR